MVFLLVIFVLSSASVCANSVEPYVKKINGFPVTVISVDLNDPSISVKPAVAGKGKKYGYPTESFYSFINRTEPVAAINGTYHDTITYKPTGTIIVDGKVENIGCVGTVVAFTYNGDIQFYLADGFKKYYIPWNSFEHAICTGPTLVYNNEIYLNARKEGFRDPRVLGYASRSVLGYTNDDHLLFVTIKHSVSLKETAMIMKALGCKYAVCLDGGGSSGLYCGGKYLTRTGRVLTNFIAVTQDKTKEYGFLYKKR